VSPLSPVHTSDNVAQNGDIVAETGNIVAIVPSTQAKPATIRQHCCQKHNVASFGDIVAGFGDNVAVFGDNVAVFGDIVAGVDGLSLRISTRNGDRFSNNSVVDLQ